MAAQKDLIYGLNDRPPLRETLFAALQHLLAIFVAIITPPLIIIPRRTVRFVGTLRPAAGTTAVLRTPARSLVSAPSLKS